MKQIFLLKHKVRGKRNIDLNFVNKYFIFILLRYNKDNFKPLKINTNKKNNNNIMLFILYDM